MKYKKSENIWINVDTLNFNTKEIEHYNIYTDTAVVDLPCDNVFYVGFETIADKLNEDENNQIMMDPKLQHLATEGNIIVTIIDQEGNKYVSNVNYDEETNEIYPPI